MRHTKAALVLGALLSSGVFSQESNPPKDLLTPNPGRGTAEDYLHNIRAKWLETPEGRHAAVLFLQLLPDTTVYVDRPLAPALKADLIRLLSDDLGAAAWADIV